MQKHCVFDEPTRRATKENGEFVEQICLMNCDGTDSLFHAKLPLPEWLEPGDQSQGVLVTRRYLKTKGTDDEGRVIYAEG